MFGGAGPAIGNHWGIGSLLDIVDDDARVKMRDSAQRATDVYAKRSLAAARQASVASEQSMLYGLGCQRKKHNGWEADVIYRDDIKLKSFKEKLQEEIDEWLEKVLD